MPIVHESDLLQRAIGVDRPLTPAEATMVLDWKLPPEDHHRLERLNAKANDGVLSETEREELEAYIRVGHLLGRLTIRARLTLNTRVAQPATV